MAKPAMNSKASVNKVKSSSANTGRTQRNAKAKPSQPATSSKLHVDVIQSNTGLHQRNRHHGHYDFSALVNAEPALKGFLRKNPRGQDTINFADPEAVKLLNKALLAHHYGIQHWDIPQGFLCPPIPGRADYIHRIAELLYNDCPEMSLHRISMLDIGVGANCIYPIIASVDYGWQVVGSDIDPISVKSAQLIVDTNPSLKNNIECRLQSRPQAMFTGIINAGERFALTTCNPPFHSSLAEAQQGTQRKQANLKRNQHKRGANAMVQPMLSANNKATLNFGGQKAELWCPGGEAAFLKNMALESAKFSQQVLWFSSLISKKDNVRWMKKQLQAAGAVEAKVVEMSQGQKMSRFIAWTFLNAEQRKDWLTHLKA